jgi:PhzF family phenazine biosynthesis protein
MTRGGSTVRFAFVDVFASVPLTGNPVSIVPDADGLTEAQMQAIAREFNQSGQVKESAETGKVPRASSAD